MSTRKNGSSQNPGNSEKWELRLYTAGQTPKSLAAIKNLKVERQSAPASRPAAKAIESASPAETSKRPNATSTSNCCGLSAVKISASANSSTTTETYAMRRNIREPAQ